MKHGNVDSFRRLSARQRVTETPPPRTGVSLIELLIVITMTTIILSMVGVIFHLLMRSEKISTQSFVAERTITQLGIQFRDDVHRATSGEVIAESDDQRNELALGDASGVRVRYVVTSQGLSRRVIDQGVTMSREDFRLPDCEISLKGGAAPDSQLRIVVIERPNALASANPTAPRPKRATRIEAFLNRPQRHSAASPTKEPAAIPDSTSSATEENQ